MLIEKRFVLAVLLVALFFGGTSLQAAIVGFLSTPDTNGIVTGDGSDWGADEDGYRVSWTISQNPDMSWHYKYEFSKGNGDLLSKLTSHFTISLSDDIQAGDLYDFSGDITDVEFNTFDPAPSNPNFPVGETIFGAKFDLWDGPAVVEFDSNRQPMWGDFYTKSGVTGELWNYAYNSDLGVAVANLHDYNGLPVDAFNNGLHKILVPNTIPEPATICLLGLGGLALLRKPKAGAGRMS